MQENEKKMQENEKKMQENEKNMQENEKKMQENEKKIQENEKKIQENEKKIFELDETKTELEEMNLKLSKENQDITVIITKRLQIIANATNEELKAKIEGYQKELYYQKKVNLDFMSSNSSLSKDYTALNVKFIKDKLAAATHKLSEFQKILEEKNAINEKLKNDLNSIEFDIYHQETIKNVQEDKELNDRKIEELQVKVNSLEKIIFDKRFGNNEEYYKNQISVLNERLESISNKKNEVYEEY